MAFALKLHLRSTHHEIPSISFKNIVRNQQAPLFKVQPIRTTGLSHLHFQSRRKSIYGYNASYIEGLEQSNKNGGGGGDGVDDKRKYRGGGGDDGRGDAWAREVLRFFFRFVEFLLFFNDGDNNNNIVGFPRKLAWLCGQVCLAMIAICYDVFLVVCFGVFIVYEAISFMFHQFVN